MNLTRNPKRIAAAAILLTASAFLLAAYGTISHVPAVFYLLYFGAAVASGVLTVSSQKQEEP